MFSWLDIALWAAGGTAGMVNMMLTLCVFVLTVFTLGGVNSVTVPTEPRLPGVMPGG